jgi:nucleoside-diphosphate-sugar epimerase
LKLFVTGGTGFIGSHFLQEALHAGHEIIALRRPNSKTRIPLETQPQWLDGELDKEYPESLQGCDALVHFAAHTPNPPYDSYENCFYWNVTATLQLFNRAMEAGVQNFVVAGSCFEYGKAAESYDKIPVDAPLEPTASYPSSKAEASKALSAWATEKEIHLQILRLFHVFGEGENPSRLFPSLHRAAISGEDYQMTAGDQVRDFISVKQVAQQFLHAVTSDLPVAGVPRIRNIGTGNPQTVREFSEYWWKKWEATGQLQIGVIPYRDNEVMRYLPEV